MKTPTVFIYQSPWTWLKYLIQGAMHDKLFPNWRIAWISGGIQVEPDIQPGHHDRALIWYFQGMIKLSVPRIVFRPMQPTCGQNHSCTGGCANQRLLTEHEFFCECRDQGMPF